MKAVLKAVAVIMIVILTVSVERKVSDVQPSSEKKFITYAVDECPDNLKLTSVRTNEDKDLLCALFSGLVKKDASGKVVTSLCESFSVSDDGIEYIFTLRDDIYYSNGDKITAEDYKNFLRDFISDKDNAYAADLDSIYGAPAFRNGETGFDGVAVSADDRILKIRLNESCEHLLDVLASPALLLRDYSSLETFKDSYKSLRYTGPFVIKDVNDDGIYISRNEKYYDKDITNETIRLSLCDNKAESLAKFEDSKSDNIDIIKNVPVNEVQRLKDAGRLKVYGSSSSYYMEFSSELTGGYSKLKTSIEECIDRKQYSQELSKDFIVEQYAVLDDEDTKEAFNEESGSNKDEEEKEFTKPLRIIYKPDAITRYIAGKLKEEIKEELELEAEEIQCGEEDYEGCVESGEYEILIDRYDGVYGYESEFSDEILKKEKSVVPIISESSTVSIREGVDGASVTSYGTINLEKVIIKK